VVLNGAVVRVHQLPDVRQRLAGDLASMLVSGEERLPKVAAIAQELAAPGSDLSEVLVDGVCDQALERGTAAVADLVGHAPGRTVLAQRREQDQIRHLRPIDRVVGDVTFGVGLGARDQACGLIGRSSDRDRVLAALAHLLTVDPSSTGASLSSASGSGKYGWSGL
jgi:hypothetical protein